MTDGPDRLIRFRTNAEDDGSTTVETLASRALRVLASKRVSAVSLMSERFIQELEAAAKSPDDGRRRVVVRDMMDSGIRREDIADFYIPEAARRLGAAWCVDNVSFADVTIGVARLQGMLRDLCSDWFKEIDVAPDAPGVMIVVAEDEFHTLGAMVLSGQLRRMGVSVKLVIGRGESELLRLVAEGQFDAILLSAAQGEKLASLRNLIEKIRTAAVRQTPVILGGAIVTQVADAKTRTGADYATTDPREALRLCGLKISHRGARPRATSE